MGDKTKEKKRIDEMHERSSMERHSRDRDSTSESRDGREQMPPPNPRRTSTEPADDKDSKRRKLDHQHVTTTDGRRDKDRVDRKRPASLEPSNQGENAKKSERKKETESSTHQNGSSVTSSAKRSKKHVEVSDKQLEQDFDDLPDHSKTKHKSTSVNGEEGEISSNSNRSKSKSTSSSRRSESKSRK